MTKEMGKIGVVSHYYTNIEVAVIELSDKIKVGDNIKIKGATTDFTQLAKSMQIDNKPVNEAGSGDSIGLKVNNRVRKGDIVYKIEG
jgi:putative protease